MKFEYLINSSLIDNITLIANSYGFTLHAKPDNKGKRIVKIECYAMDKMKDLFTANNEITKYLNESL